MKLKKVFFCHLRHAAQLCRNFCIKNGFIWEKELRFRTFTTRQELSFGEKSVFLNCCGMWQTKVNKSFQNNFADAIMFSILLLFFIFFSSAAIILGFFFGKQLCLDKHSFWSFAFIWLKFFPAQLFFVGSGCFRELLLWSNKFKKSFLLQKKSMKKNMKSGFQFFSFWF